MSATNGAFFTEQFLKPNGDPAAGVRVFHYVAGNTTTNLDVYQNGNLTAPHNNPVVGDAVGRVSFYGSGTYRLLVKTAADDPDYPNQTLYDWDPVELVHHTATVRAEDKGLSLPAASAAARGRLFGTTDAGGDLTGLYIQQTASQWASLLSGGLLTNILQFAKGTTIASTTSVTVPNDGNFFDVTGTNNIESLSGFAGYPIIYLRTLQALTFVHNSTNLILLGAANRTTLANQVTAFLHLGAGQWMELYYTNPFFGDGNFIDGSVLVGNVQGAITDLALPIAGRVLGHIGTAGLDPSWITGLSYHGPTATSGSFGHEGNVTIASNQALYGTHYYTNFALNAGVTVTLGAGTKRLVIIASDSITINGAINAVGAGATSGQHGTDQPGGNGSSGPGATPGTAGSALIHGCVNLGPGQQVGSAYLSLAMHPALAMGGAGGGTVFDAVGGDTAQGGTGGGSIVLIAPLVILGGGCVLNTAGSPGGSTANSFGAGGGGAGNVYIVTRTFVNNGATFTMTGGAGGGLGTVTGNTGSAGQFQLLTYGA